ncbi:MAG: metallophosphoesterase family protein [Nitrososphaerota archaeon]|nr:metallophosphoesterase family protein [Nitrososphaerota archaeon]
MGKYAFVSDIHANAEALAVVAERIEGLRTFILGDLVGYGADPEAAVDWAKSAGTAVRGNHDDAAASGDTDWFNMNAAVGIGWARGRLGEGRLSYLASLPLRQFVDLDGCRVMLVHGSPEEPLREYVYPQTHEHLFDYYLTKYSVDVVAMGHTHVPFASKAEKGLVFNPGSVGQPRDGDPRASYSVLEVGDGGPRVQNFRVDYDAESAARKISEAGLPRSFGLRLRSGR